jgi:hypothetical protein
MAPPLAIAIDSGTVLILITLAVLPVAALSFARSGRAWSGLGKGRFAIEPEPAPRRSAPPDPGAERVLQEIEARQMLEAKSYRRRRSGGAPLDVEAEVRALLEGSGGAGSDAGEELRAEVRALVITRNERRMRNGQEPLDVEAETERQLEDLLGSSQ